MKQREHVLSTLDASLAVVLVAVITRAPTIVHYNFASERRTLAGNSYQ